MRSGYLFHALLATKTKQKVLLFPVSFSGRSPARKKNALTHSLTHSLTQLNSRSRSTRTPGRSWARPAEQLASLPDTSLSWDAK